MDTKGPGRKEDSREEKKPKIRDPDLREREDRLKAFRRGLETWGLRGYWGPGRLAKPLKKNTKI